MPNTPKKRGRKPGPLNVLTDRQRRFVEEYVVDMNGTQAAVRAGYSPKSSGLHATMMASRAVRAAVEDALAAKRARSEVAADRVVAELARVAFANVLDLIDDDGGIDLAAVSRATAAGVARVAVEYEPERTSRTAGPTPLSDAGASESRPPHEGEGSSSEQTRPHRPRLRGDEREPDRCAPGDTSPVSRGRRVRRMAISMADKTAALNGLVRCLGLDRGGWRAEAPDEYGEVGGGSRRMFWRGQEIEVPERVIQAVNTGVPRYQGDPCVRWMPAHPIARAVLNQLLEWGWREPDLETLVAKGMARAAE